MATHSKTKKEYRRAPNCTKPGTVRLSKSPFTVTVLINPLRKAANVTQAEVCKPRVGPPSTSKKKTKGKSPQHKTGSGVGTRKQEQENQVRHGVQVQPQIQVFKQQKLCGKNQQKVQCVF